MHITNKALHAHHMKTPQSSVESSFLVFSSSLDTQLYYYYNNKKYHLNIKMLLINEKKENVLFNDTLNTFYLWLYDVRHMVKNHTDSEGGTLLPPHELLFTISSNGYFICIIPQTG